MFVATVVHQQFKNIPSVVQRFHHQSINKLHGLPCLKLLGRASTQERFRIAAVLYNVRCSSSHSNSDRIKWKPKKLKAKAGLVQLDHDTSFGHVVYEGPLTPLSRGVKLFSLSNSVLFTAIQPFVYKVVLSWPPLLQLFYGTAFTFFTFAQTGFIHFITSRYVTKLYFDYEKKVFTADLMNVIGATRSWQFTARDVSVVSSMLASIKVQATKVDSEATHTKYLLLDSRSFMDRDAYLHLMGYDKPMDILNVEKTTGDDDDFKEEWARKAAEFDRMVELEENDPFKQQLDKIRVEIESDSHIDDQTDILSHGSENDSAQQKTDGTSNRKESEKISEHA